MTDQGVGIIEMIREGLLSMHGSLERHRNCTKEKDPAKRCMQCPAVFPSVTANKKHTRSLPLSSISKLLKEGYQWLEAEGWVTEGEHKRISTSSLRRGGNTMAAAEGIRQTVRAKHGRWKSEATVTEYDGLAPGENAVVSKALNARLRKARNGNKRERVAQRKQGRMTVGSVQ